MMMRSLTAMFLLLAGASPLPGQNPPSVRTAVAPHYPAISVLARVAGEVLVIVKVDAHGDVAAASTKSGPPLLLTAAENAAKQWKFDSSSNGEREVQLSFEFVLLSEAENTDSDVKFLPPYQVAVEVHPAKPYVSDKTRAESAFEQPPGANSTDLLVHESGHADLPKPQ
jgi:TonB family protein